MDQLATSVSKLEEREGKLPSQAEQHPQADVSLVVTRNRAAAGEETEVKNNPEPIKKKKGKDQKETKRTSQESEIEEPTIKILPPFRRRLQKNQKDDEDRAIAQVFNKVEINIPQLAALQQIPRYTKYMKDLCTKKIKYVEKVYFVVNANVSAMI